MLKGHRKQRVGAEGSFSCFFRVFISIYIYSPFSFTKFISHLCTRHLNPTSKNITPSLLLPFKDHLLFIIIMNVLSMSTSILVSLNSTSFLNSIPREKHTHTHRHVNFLTPLFLSTLDHLHHPRIPHNFTATYMTNTIF